jgi:hypothetical protein
MTTEPRPSGLSRLERVAWFVARHDAGLAILIVVAVAAVAFVLLR